MKVSDSNVVYVYARNIVYRAYSQKRACKGLKKYAHDIRKTLFTRIL